MTNRWLDWSDEKTGPWKAGIFFVAIILLVAGVVWGTAWYKAGVQQDVYRRQGVEMSQWEIFIGSKPVERYIKQ